MNPMESDTTMHLLRPVWSHQHGAYITLLTSWLIGTMLSSSVGLIHAVILMTLMAGFNGIELFQEYLKKKMLTSRQKRIWAVVYGVITGAGIPAIWWSTETATFVLPVLLLSGFVFIGLSLRRKQKSIAAELLAFANLSLAGLLAFDPLTSPGEHFLHLWLLLFCYFGVSVFLVKARFGKVSALEILSYVVICTGSILWTVDWRDGVILVLAFMSIKALSVLLAAGWYRRLSIRTIGFMELGSCLLVVAFLNRGW